MDERELDRLAEMVVAQLQGGARVENVQKAQVRGELRKEANTHSSATTNAPTTRPDDLAPLIDHTLLVPEATQDAIERLCAEALQHGFAAVCVDGSWVRLCTELLHDSEVSVASVAGFPHGAMTSRAKASQTVELVDIGADEIDMVAPIGRIVDGDWDYVERDIAGVVAAANGRIVKVILETAVLSPARIVQGAAIAMEAGAHFVKTSTGLHPAGGATEEAVALLRAAVGERLGVKAAGGIRNRETALSMVAAGATRIGTSSGVAIVS